jgi:hypothetical protein
VQGCVHGPNADPLQVTAQEDEDFFGEIDDALLGEIITVKSCVGVNTLDRDAAWCAHFVGCQVASTERPFLSLESEIVRLLWSDHPRPQRCHVLGMF